MSVPSSRPSLGEELRAVLRLGLPVAGTQVAFMLIGVVDTMMLGRVDALSLAAGGIGNMWHWAWLSVGLGLVLGMDPIISQGFGRGDRNAVAVGVQRGLVVALLASVPVVIAQAATGPSLAFLGQPAEVADAAQRYNLARLPAVPGFLCFTALRVYLQGRGIVLPPLGVAFVANGVNAFLCWVLIFGKLGAPALGIVGAGIASSVTFLFMLVALALWIRVRALGAEYWRPWDGESFSQRGLLQIVRLGLPVGVQTGLEVWAFSLAMVMAGWLGVSELASHQIVLNLAALSFMVPLGVSIGAATRVGNLIGAEDLPAARRALWLSQGLGAGWALLAGSLFVLFKDSLPKLFTEDVAVVNAAAAILPFVAAFQLFDASQAVGGGGLRGMGRPHASALINLIGFYVCALPLGYLLAFRLHQGLSGIWAALLVGLGLVAGGLLFWTHRTSHRPLSELTVRAEGLDGE
jgi:MATE family multidrug resistance protein